MGHHGWLHRDRFTTISMADYHTSFCQNFPIFLKLQAMETIGRENDHLSQSNFKYCQCKWTLMTLVRIPRRIITIFGVENFGKNKSWFFFHLPNFLSLINWMSIIQNFSRKVLIIKTVDVLGGENQGWLAFFQTPKKWKSEAELWKKCILEENWKSGLHII
jgi:hypothetical protein